MISARGLRFSYGTHTLAFPDFEIGQSEPCLLLGESGSGKTTLLHILGGLRRGYEGSVRVAGLELSSLSETQLDKFRGQRMGFVFQKNHLLGALTVEENLLMAPYLSGLKADRQRVDETLARLNLADKRKSKVSEISQGQAQRVA
ncbi:MAG: ATP-binding cassette domain-containing protein, partial [Bacteroidia bacterium]|nr:ATP-binding cassette domain-containing protein [Bacteroidia bacterium]